MPFALCLRADGGAEGAADAVCANWLSIMHPTPPVPPGWAQVPSALLHEGMVAAWFHAGAFVEHTTSARVAPDTRPLITPQMRIENRQEWDRLWDLNKPDECPVCHEKPDIWYGPMNSDTPTRCTHWGCLPCWEQIADRDRRCPICREDLTTWLHETIARSTSTTLSETDSDDDAHGSGFSVGDHVRVSRAFGGYVQLRGARGLVTRRGADITVSFIEPVPVIGGVSWRTFTHSHHNFQHVRG